MTSMGDLTSEALALWPKMNVMARAPGWLMAAAVVLVGQTLVLFAIAPSLTAVSAVVVALVIALWVLRSSRVAWVVALVGAGGQFVGSVIAAGHYWALSVGGVLMICLLAPPSIRYVWSQRLHRQPGKLQLAAKRIYERIVTSVYGLVGHVPDWENGQFESITTYPQRSYKLLLWRLGIGCVFLFGLYAVAYKWQHGSGDGSSIVNVIASVTRACYVLVQVLFIVVSLVAVWRYLVTSPASPKSAGSKPK